jgi:CheY-like chemotaxis protein
MTQPAYSSEGNSPVVLIVDDNAAIRDMVSWALELDGYEAAEAAEGQEALDWIDDAAREGRHPAVILLDLAMPGMDGSSFLNQLHTSWSTFHIAYPMPVVVAITANAASFDAKSLGVERIVIKPFHLRDILDLVRVLARN